MAHTTKANFVCIKTIQEHNLMLTFLVPPWHRSSDHVTAIPALPVTTGDSAS